jgi:hypothetical protein
MTASDGGESAGYGHLPATKLTTDLVQAARLECSQLWSAYDVESEYPILAQLALQARVSADDLLRRERDNPAATVFHAEWADLERRYSRAADRGYLLSTPESYARLETVIRFLTASGLMSLREAERDAPRNYLHKREREGVD